MVARGGGTKLGWGPPPRSIDVLLSTSRLNRVVAHRHGDLTATVQAGAAFDEVNRQLAQHGQWLPLDRAMAESAPRSAASWPPTTAARAASLRRAARSDHRRGIRARRRALAKAGGIVVKNVAGYDLPRLMTGSFGSLAVIVSATFKLLPPYADVENPGRGSEEPAGSRRAVSAAVPASHLTPTAVEFETHPLKLLVRFESIEAAVDQRRPPAPWR